MAAIHQCGTCNLPIGPSPIPEKTLIVTSCFHIFYLDCLKDWVTESTKPCPLCKAVCYQLRAAKDFPIVWKMFLIALEKMPEPTLEALGSSDHINGQCSICTEDFPLIPLFFDPDQKQLFHNSCTPPDSAVQLTADDIVAVVKKCAEKDSELKKLLTPSPPSLFEKYPYASQIAAVIGGVAVLSLSLFATQKFFR